MVIYVGGNAYTLRAYISPGSASDRIGFKNDNAGIDVKCIIRGHDLVFGGGDGNDPFYIFDFDFDEQHKKTWELNDGQYLLQLPILLGTLDKTYYAIINASLSDNSITLCVNSTDGSTGYQPIGADAELEDIDVASWFDNMVGTAARDVITSIMENILDMEYGVRPDVHLDTFEPSIDGTFNPYTDGGDYIPLRIVSRFPNGSPIRDNNQDGVFVTFNRNPKSQEINNKIYVVVETGGNIYGGYLRNQYSNNYYLTGHSSISFRINGNEIITSFGGDNFLVYDIDYDHQFRRSFPTGLVKMNVQIPQLLDRPSAGQGIGIIHEEEVPENFGIFADSNNNPLIVNGDTLQNEEGAWANDMQWSSVRSLLEAIIAMEFEGFSDNPPSVAGTQYREALATGFTVTPLIPQTLS